ncbi:antitoxin Xre/MbcA/ParS toxin-binding domain-containing protein [Massilia sp. CMS3.1]|uniref:antitoxin Xre/MbcA/ParS toxin-binding domain-containing protein n=1 Tax=Massilia sp. CMS3.1 TaxID=3373083 RepID=UPI003EE55A46
MTHEGPLTPDSLAALRERFGQQSRKAQAYYAVMHAVTGILGSDEAASNWMEAPLAAFDGNTPAALVGDGRENDLLEHIRSMKPGKP